MENCFCLPAEADRKQITKQSHLGCEIIVIQSRGRETVSCLYVENMWSDRLKKLD
ncbi:MAG: hypothetical protein ACYT04_63865 [Nostoc sp.]